MTAKEFYEANATTTVNVPRVGHPEDKSGWDGVRRASQAQYIAPDVEVMPLWDVFDFAEKFRQAGAASQGDAAKKLSDLLCPPHANLDAAGHLEPFDNCIACIRVHRDELLAGKLCLKCAGVMEPHGQCSQCGEYPSALPAAPPKGAKQ